MRTPQEVLTVLYGYTEDSLAEDKRIRELDVAFDSISAISESLGIPFELFPSVDIKVLPPIILSAQIEAYNEGLRDGNAVDDYSHLIDKPAYINRKKEDVCQRCKVGVREGKYCSFCGYYML